MKLFSSHNRSGGGTPFFIFAGQSNLGRSRVSEMTGGEASIYDVNFSNTQILGLLSSEFEQINPGTNTILYNFINSDEFGPETSFAKRFQDIRGGDCYILKYGVGNTSLAVDWAASSTNREALKGYITSAINDASLVGKILNIEAFVWMQGENDATNSSWADDYLTNLDGFFAELENHVGKRFKKIIGRINGASDPSEVYRSTVRAAQSDFCNDGSNWATLIDTDSYPLRDSVHYSATGQISFGIDIYNAL